MKRRNQRSGQRGSALLPVFFTPNMVARSGSFSPSAAKPLQAVESWKRRGFPIEIHEPTPVTVEELSRVHDREHVLAILEGREPNGFGNCSLEVAASLPFTSGSMLSAARHVLRHGGAACAPCSGFHHAGFDFSGGYCTFNGLMVTASALRQEGLARKVGIIDCDTHPGDGTEDIISRLGAASWVRHFTAGPEFDSPDQVPAFFERLGAEVAAMADCDIVLYQAGADPHINDWGAWLTTDEMRLRDALVFEGLHRRGVPVAWNLAGGYQKEPDGSIPKVLAIHDNTVRECVKVYGLGTQSRPSCRSIR